MTGADEAGLDAKGLHVLHVIPSVSPLDGGPTAAMALMERGLRAAGVRVTTLATDWGLPPAAGPRPWLATFAGSCAPGCDEARVLARAWASRYKPAPGLLAFLAHETARFDLVHVHGLFSFAPVVAAAAARWAGVPYVVRPLGALDAAGLETRRRSLKRLSLQLIERRMLERAAAVHVASRAELVGVRRLGIAARGVIIPLGVPPDDGEGDGARLARPADADGSLEVLVLSRLAPGKNVEVVIDAIATSVMLRARCCLTIAGTGRPDHVAALQARAAAAGIAPQVRWLGHVEGAAKREALQQAQVLVSASQSESFGLAVVEAMQAGLPCVLSEGIAIAGDAAVHGAALLARPEAGSVAGALERLVADAGLRLEMGTRAKLLVARDYSLEAMAGGLVQLYERVRHERRPLSSLPRQGAAVR